MFLTGRNRNIITLRRRWGCLNVVILMGDGEKGVRKCAHALLRYERLLWKCGCHRMTASPLRHGDGMADAAEGVIAAVTAAGGDDKVVFAAGDWVVKDDFGGDWVAFENFRLLDDLRLVETAAIALFQPEALVGLGGVHHDVVP